MKSEDCKAWEPEEKALGLQYGVSPASVRILDFLSFAVQFRHMGRIGSEMEGCSAHFEHSVGIV